jgi:hypothetical protein
MTHHDAGISRPNGVSQRTLNGMKTPNPRCFGVWGVISKKVEAKKPNRINIRSGNIWVSASADRALLALRGSVKQQASVCRNARRIETQVCGEIQFARRTLASSRRHSSRWLASPFVPFVQMAVSVAGGSSVSSTAELLTSRRRASLATPATPPGTTPSAIGYTLSSGGSASPP